jgi:hydrogenase expression/formation protein HypE
MWPVGETVLASKPYRIRGVLFDFDGTLTCPDTLDLNVVKEQVGCPAHLPVLEFITQMSEPSQRAEALAQLDDFEMAAAQNARPNWDAEKLLDHLARIKLPKGIISRNSRASILRALENFGSVAHPDFDPIITRDDPVKTKPSGEGIRFAARKWGLSPAEVLVVGDFTFDMEAGRRAGALTALLENAPLKILPDCRPDFRIRRLGELLPILRMGAPRWAGKLPNDILEAVLQGFDVADPSVLISAGVGDDTAAVDVRHEEVLVLKSDPITFATDAVGHYAVLVNANDIATAGARPRWFLTTLLFPLGSSASQIRWVMGELFQVCQTHGITLCGGHTELTDAVTRPVISGMMAGTVPRSKLVDKRNMRPGDHVLITKAVAVEGTAIIAREFSQRLLQMGVTQEVVSHGRAFLSHIGILPEAAIAARHPGVSAMHDVTEGGLATALVELSVAGDHRLHINRRKIPIFNETGLLCRLLGLDPLGLIGSGSLLICCRPATSRGLSDQIAAQGIRVTHIGRVLDAGRGIEAVDGGQSWQWPQFDVDEITKLFGDG